MRFLFYLGHPHHYLTIRFAADELVAAGHEVRLVARHKDVLLDLLRGQPHPVEVVSRREIRSAVAGRTLGILNREWRIFRRCLAWRPDLLVGTDLVITHVGRLLRIPSAVFNEDDAAVVPLMARFGFRFANHIIAPESCDLGPYESKKIGYRGVQELAYLSPRRFTPRADTVRRYGLEPEEYSLLRLAKLSAHHDWGKRGIHDDLARRLVARLERHGDVYISSERELPGDLEERRLPIDPRDIHHVLALARLLVCDSQTMTTEAAVLGTPVVRYNDFVGRIGAMIDMESRHRLMVGLSPGDEQRLLDVVDAMASSPDIRREWGARRQRYLDEVVDVTDFLVETFVALAERRALAIGAPGARAS